jgi:murein DD-endopeptidase MepM/ murein hydrolase activator NlpD
VLAGIAVYVLGGERPVLRLQPPLKTIGLATPLTVKLSAPDGVRHFQAWMEQGGNRYSLMDQPGGGPRWQFWRPRQADPIYRFIAGRKTVPQLQDGAARLVIEAQSDDWRRRVVTAAFDIAVRSVPPQLSANGAQHYINQGGAELVVFTVGPEAIESGVRVGSYRFRSWTLPGAPAGARFALFVFPWDVSTDTAPLVYARDEAGNEATASFWFRVFPKKFRSRELELSDEFMRKVTTEIQQRTPAIQPTGDLLKDFLQINGELRRANNYQLADLRLQTEERFLWSERFRQLADSQVEAQFADHRRYVYRGAKVDEQDHLGFDLAKTLAAPVVASNDGKVVFADYLGIYGNCVVVDHGYGLQSIYGHLSSIGVKPGESVRQGQELGRSGSTGLAGGDHLHFSMQLDGVPTNPVEWWDEHWIHDRVLLKFPDKKLPGR